MVAPGLQIWFHIQEVISNDKHCFWVTTHHELPRWRHHILSYLWLGADPRLLAPLQDTTTKPAVVGTLAQHFWVVGGAQKAIKVQCHLENFFLYCPVRWWPRRSQWVPCRRALSCTTTLRIRFAWHLHTKVLISTRLSSSSARLTLYCLASSPCMACNAQAATTQLMNTTKAVLLPHTKPFFCLCSSFSFVSSISTCALWESRASTCALKLVLATWALLCILIALMLLLHRQGWLYDTSKLGASPSSSTKNCAAAWARDSLSKIIRGGVGLKNT